jgi:hypothetical protein
MEKPKDAKTAEIILDEMETLIFETAHDARCAKIAPAERQYLEIKAQADARYNDIISKVLKRHGLTKIPDTYKLMTRDDQGNLVVPAKFVYTTD